MENYREYSRWHHVFHAHNFPALDHDRCAVAEDACAAGEEDTHPHNAPQCVGAAGRYL